jgi:hypothetical protein
MEELFTNFTEYRAGHPKNSIEIDVKEKRKGEPRTDDKVKNCASASPTWGKIKRNSTPFALDWESKGDSSTSQLNHDNGWGKPLPRPRANERRRIPPRDDRRSERQKFPPNSKSLNRNTYTRKRSASPSKEVQP